MKEYMLKKRITISEKVREYEFDINSISPKMQKQINEEFAVGNGNFLIVVYKDVLFHPKKDVVCYFNSDTADFNFTFDSANICIPINKNKIHIKVTERCGFYFRIVITTIPLENS